MAKSERFFRRQDDYEINEHLSRITATVNEERSKTLQGPMVDCDINNIARSYGLVNFARLPVPPEALDARFYGDLTEAPSDLQSAMNIVMDARYKFERLPADLRAKFDHSPAVLWDWLQDPGHMDEAVNLGLLVRPAVPAPPSVPEVAS